MLDFYKLRFSGNVPRVHPNGFIQLDLAPHQRLHVWTRFPLVKQKTWHPVHDHNFDLTSRVIVGTLLNNVFTFHPTKKGIYRRYHVVYTTRHDAQLVPTTEHGVTEFVKLQVIQMGRKYTLPRQVLHTSMPSTFSKYVATIMESSKIDKSLPISVLVPRDMNPDSFDRFKYNQEQTLWDEIRAALELQGKEQ